MQLSCIIPFLKLTYLLWDGAVSQEPGVSIPALAGTSTAPNISFWQCPPVVIVVVVVVVVAGIDWCCGAVGAATQAAIIIIS